MKLTKPPASSSTAACSAWEMQQYRVSSRSLQHVIARSSRTHAQLTIKSTPANTLPMSCLPAILTQYLSTMGGCSEAECRNALGSVRKWPPCGQGRASSWSVVRGKSTVRAQDQCYSARQIPWHPRTKQLRHQEPAEAPVLTSSRHKQCVFVIDSGIPRAALISPFYCPFLAALHQ